MNTSIINPKKFIEYLRQSGRLKKAKAPRTIIFIFLEGLLDYCKKHYNLKKVEGFDAGELYDVDESGSVGIFYCRGIGAPVAVINLEELIAFGAEHFIVVGTAGALQKHLNIGDVILCQQAIADEGTSKHYVKDQTIAAPDPVLHQNYKAHMLQTGIVFEEGSSWTTDAPYRETEEKVITFQAQGVLSVEMEISALFAVAQFQKASVVATFVVSDSLAELTWSPGFFSEKVMESLQTLIDVAIQFSKKCSVNIETISRVSEC